MTPSTVYSLWSITAFLYFNFPEEANSIRIIKPEGNKTNSAVKHTYPAFGIPLNKEKYGQNLLLCPAVTPAEKKLNEAFSISGNSLFTVDRIDLSPNTPLNICLDPIKPAIIYNLVDQTYEIGYELYIEEPITNQRSSLSKNYHYYAPIQENNEVINSTKIPHDDQFHLHTLKYEYEDGEWTVIKIAEEPYRPRIFHWKCELYLKYRGFDTLSQREISIGDVSDDDLKFKCPEDSSIYSRQNQDNCLTDIETSEMSPETQNQHKPNTISYFEKSQIIPSWYLHTSWAKLASCARMNIVPICKTIADGQLKKVNLYLLSAEYQLRLNSNYKIAATIFGVSGILNLPTKTDPKLRRDVYLWDFQDPSSQKIPVPKIIYRIFSLESIHCGQYSVAIIIHNKKATVPDSERICDARSQPSGWSMIENNDIKLGLTYACSLTSEVVSKLGGFEGTSMSFYEAPLRLNSIPNCEQEHKSSKLSGSYESFEPSGFTEISSKAPENRDETLRINKEFERLLQLA